MTFEHTWRGISGCRYNFQISHNCSDWPYWSGVYLLCSHSRSGWKAHAIGECDNLRETLAISLQAALQCNSTPADRVHFLLCSEPMNRKRIIADLLITLESRCYQSFFIPEELVQVA